MLIIRYMQCSATLRVAFHDVESRATMNRLPWKKRPQHHRDADEHDANCYIPGGMDGAQPLLVGLVELLVFLFFVLVFGVVMLLVLVLGIHGSLSCESSEGGDAQFTCCHTN
jgi:hypothetical protein